MFDLNGRVAIVTGAAGNLGQAVARAFARTGARRVLVDRAPDRLVRLYPEAAGSGEVLLGSGFDLAMESDARRLVDTVLQRFQRIDVLVNAVGGFAGGKALHEEDIGTWERMFSINLHTALNSCRAVVPHLLRQGGGRIVNVAARAALAGVPTLAAYCASKSALVRLSESLAAELKDQGITVNCVLPGTIDTPQNRRDMPGADFSRWVAPEAIADVILFLASDAARAVSGASIPVYGRS
jgi:NAD(P)-dependent dehydrogenase (short-subunit alcohol dehydrogenase family)